MKTLPVILLIVLMATNAFAKTYTVGRVVTGDMIELANGKMVRLIGIDAPESADDAIRAGLDPDVIERVSEDAKKYLTDYINSIPNKQITLEFDVEKKDKYYKSGRLLAYVFVDTGLIEGEPVDFKHAPNQHFDYYHGKYMHFLNATMMKEGHATAMTFQPNVKYAPLLEGLEEEARQNKTGMWRELNPDREEKEYYDDGTLKLHMVIYNEATSEGVWREYHENGTLKVEADLIQITGGCSDEVGIPIEGFVEEYYDNGKLRMSGNFKNNCEDGIHTYYTPEGLLEEELSYTHGTILWAKRYNKDGKGYVIEEYAAKEQQSSTQGVYPEGTTATGEGL